jgi:lipoprotein-anchoring transpeptidase ErfK/SrfK
MTEIIVDLRSIEMSSEEKKGRLSEDDVGTAEETTNFEDRINATLDKILDDEDDELDDIVVDYEDSGEAEEDVDNLDKTIEVSKDNGEFQEDYEKTIVWNGPSEQDSEEEIYEEPEEEEEKPIVRNKHKSARPAPVIYVPVDDIDQEVPVPENVKQNKKHGYKGLRIFGLLVLMIAVLGGCAYGGISYYFSNRFFEGTWINGIDCSQKTAYEVEELMKEKLSEYSIEVSSRDVAAQTIKGEDIDYKYMSTGEILQLLRKQKPYEWVKGLYEQKSYTVDENVGYNKTLLQEQLKSLNCAQAENQTEPENAYVAFQNNAFVIVPETEGSKLNIKEAYKVLNAAVEANESAIDFSNTPEVYVSAAVTKDDPELQAALEACNNYTKASITYTFGDQSTTLDGNTIKDWLQFDEKGQLIWDDNSFQQHVAEYVAQLAATYDTVGTEREFQATSGRTVYVSSSVYGWKIDQAAEAAQLSQEIQSGTQTTREPIYAQTANAYGVNDLGNTYIEVDLSEQHMYYYQDGADIFESDFVSGNMSYADRQTHAGIFTLYYKKSPDVLRGGQKGTANYYEQPVQYWMPFDGGIGFHDANWRDDFGGDIYLTSGSHGCINLPPENAAVLYDLIQYDVPIVCFY